MAPAAPIAYANNGAELALPTNLVPHYRFYSHIHIGHYQFFLFGGYSH
jgi:hypothetical protein